MSSMIDLNKLLKLRSELRLIVALLEDNRCMASVCTSSTRVITDKEIERLDIERIRILDELSGLMQVYFIKVNKPK